MNIVRPAIAGTLESSDAQVTLEPAQGLSIDIQSSVLAQYGRQIRACAEETLRRLEIADARVSIVDKGSLECTLKARIECAAFRAAGEDADARYPWGGIIR